MIEINILARMIQLVFVVWLLRCAITFMKTWLGNLSSEGDSGNAKKDASDKETFYRAVDEKNRRLVEKVKHDHIRDISLDKQGKRDQLNALYEAGLLTKEEYREKCEKL